VRPLDRTERAKLERKRKDIKEARAKLRELEGLASGLKGKAKKIVDEKVAKLRESIHRADTALGEALGCKSAEVLEAERAIRREAKKAAKAMPRLVMSAEDVQAEIEEGKAKRRRRRGKKR